MRNIAMAGLAALLVVSPWFVRNLLVFQGSVLYSTQPGWNLLAGIVTPDGRTEGEDWDKLASRCGWTLPDIDTNSVSRQAFPAEPELDGRARTAAMKELAGLGVRDVASLIAEKLGLFWLS